MTLKEIVESKPSAVISRVCEVLDMKDTMLAAVLKVTEATIEYWRKMESMEAVNNTKMGARLSRIFLVVDEALKNGIPDKAIMNLLDIPFSEEEDDSSCLLNMVIDEDLYDLNFQRAIEGQIEVFKKKVSDG